MNGEFDDLLRFLHLGIFSRILQDGNIDHTDTLFCGTGDFFK